MAGSGFRRPCTYVTSCWRCPAGPGRILGRVLLGTGSGLFIGITRNSWQRFIFCDMWRNTLSVQPTALHADLCNNVTTYSYNKKAVLSQGYRCNFSRFDRTGNSAIRSVDPENPTVELNMKWIGSPVAEMWPLEIRHIKRLHLGPPFSGNGRS